MTTGILYIKIKAALLTFLDIRLLMNIRFYLLLSYIIGTGTLVLRAQNVPLDKKLLEMFIEKHTFKLNGYFRSTMSLTDKGVAPSYITPPGGRAKWRMANEPDIYAEMQLVYQYDWNKEKGNSVEVHFTPAAYLALGSGTLPFWVSGNGMNEFYFKLNNISGNTDIWSGWRYYHRRDYHPLDYFWYNPGQGAVAGLGVEGLRSKEHKDDISIALHFFESKNVASIRSFESTDAGVLPAFTLDAKWANIPLFSANSALTVGSAVSIRPAQRDLNFGLKKGFSLYLWHDQNNLCNGRASNNFQISFRKGTAMNQSSYSGAPIYETINGDGKTIMYDLDKAYYWEVSDGFLYEYAKHFSVNLIFLLHRAYNGLIPYRLEDNQSIGSGAYLTWITTGARAYWYWHRHFALTTEIGLEYVDNQPVHKKGTLFKLTLSPQIRWNYGYYSRPEIRPFITLGLWSNGLKGSVGGTPFMDRTYGITFGIQGEIWW